MLNYRSLLFLSVLLILSAGSAHAQDTSRLQFGKSKIYKMQTQPAQETSASMQTMATKRQNSEAITSNVLKKQSDTTSSITGNMK